MSASIAPANEYAEPGGVLSAEVRRLIDDIGELSTTTSISVASYYARYDPAGMLARELVDLVTAAVAAQ